MHTKKGSQIDHLDFSKALDMVPHDGLLSKLKHYGICLKGDRRRD